MDVDVVVATIVTIATIVTLGFITILNYGYCNYHQNNLGLWMLMIIVTMVG